MLYKGYAMNRMFKTPEMFGWHIYICGPELIEEVIKLPDSSLDIQEAARLVCHSLDIFMLNKIDVKMNSFSKVITP